MINFCKHLSSSKGLIQKILIVVMVLGWDLSSVYAQEVSSRVQWRELPELNCTHQEETCFKEAKKILQDSFVPFKPSKAEYADLYTYKEAREDRIGVGRFIVGAKKSPHVYVLIHGLYGDEMQFRGLAFHLAKRGQNVISLVLPGHGADWQRAPRIEFADWQLQVQRAVSLAKFLGHKVIVFGQSTGGLLASMQAIMEPNSIDGLILMEPAFKVQPKVTRLACSMKLFVRFAHESTLLAKMVGIDPNDIPKSVSPRMGCVVANARSAIIKTFQLPAESENTNSNHYTDTKESGDELRNSQMLAENIKVPTLVMNHLADEVVDPKNIAAVANSLVERGLGIYHAYNSEKFNHGIWNLFEVDKFNGVVDSFLIDKLQLQDILQTQVRHLKKVENINFTLEYMEFYKNAIKYIMQNQPRTPVQDDLIWYRHEMQLRNLAFEVQLQMIRKRIDSRDKTSHLVEQTIEELLPPGNEDWKVLSKTLHRGLSSYYKYESRSGVYSSEMIESLFKVVRGQGGRLLQSVENLQKELHSIKSR